MLPNAVTKSLQANSRCSLPLTRLQPFVFGSSAEISASVSFFAGMVHSSRIGWRSLQPLCGASPAPATALPASGEEDASGRWEDKNVHPAVAPRPANLATAWTGPPFLQPVHSTIAA